MDQPMTGDAPRPEGEGEKTLERVREVTDALVKIASGDFSVSLELTPADDEIDSIAASVSMLAEELKAGFEERDEA